MPNPFTRFINRSDPESGLARFVAAWDSLEELLIDVYRGGEATREDERQWAEIRSALESIYPAVESRIRPHLRQREESGADQVSAVLALETAREMIGNRRILQLLPDVREAVNLSLLKD